MRMHTAGLAALLALAAGQAHAINKCTGPDGKVVYQDAPCANTSQNKAPVKVWDSKLGRSANRSAEPNTQLKGPPEAQPLIDLYRRWIDAERLARSTARIALSGPIASMQALQREAEGLTVHSCMNTARDLMVELTKKSTEGMLGFMSKSGVDDIVYTVIYRGKLIPDFEHAVETANCQQP